MEICEKPNLSFFRPILVLGDSGSGKTTLVKELLKSLKGEKVVFAKENEYADLGVEWHSKFLKRDALRDGKIIAVEDLPRLVSKRMHKTLMELLTQTRHYRSHVVCTSQTEEGLDKRFLARFKTFVFFYMPLSYDKWRKLFDARIARFLKETVERLPPFRCVILDRETGAWFNSYENRDAEAVKILKNALDRRVEGQQKISDAVAEAEAEDKKLKTKTGTNLLTPLSKRSQAFRMFDEGKSCAEVVKALKLKYEVAKQYRHEWLWKRKLQFDAVDGKTFLLTVRTAESWLQSLSR